MFVLFVSCFAVECSPCGTRQCWSHFSQIISVTVVHCLGKCAWKRGRVLTEAEEGLVPVTGTISACGSW